MKLSSRWTQLKHHAVQSAYWTSKVRHNVLPCGRRSGKSEFFKRKLVKCAITSIRPDGKYLDHTDGKFFAAAPTRAQAKSIYWKDLKILTPRKLIKSISETELSIKLINGNSIHVLGMDKPERIEGQPWDGGGLDEIANMKKGAWPENVQPALADRNGWCDFLGVPEGRNHYYDLDQFAKSGESEHWSSFHWKSEDILPAEIIEELKRTVDPQTYLQEYEATFLSFSGRAYYPFDETKHCAKLEYNPRADLIFTFDFNIKPGTAAVIQEMKLPNGLEGTGIIGEVHIPTNSNTPAVCNRLIQDWGHHKGRVFCYGDATGGAGGSAQIAGSDWDLIKETLRESFGNKIYYMVPKGNPRERTRVNSVNTRLINAAGEVRMMVDPVNAKNVVKDLEGVCLLVGGSGEIDKKKTPDLTHLMDGVGYYIEKEYPVNQDRSSTIQMSGY